MDIFKSAFFKAGYIYCTVPSLSENLISELSLKKRFRLSKFVHICVNFVQSTVTLIEKRQCK
jgi:hypothetical protein